VVISGAEKGYKSQQFLKGASRYCESLEYNDQRVPGTVPSTQGFSQQRNDSCFVTGTMLRTFISGSLNVNTPGKCLTNGLACKESIFSMELARTPELSSQGFLGVKRHHITGFGEKNHVNGQVSVHFPWMNKNGPVEPQAYASMCWYLTNDYIRPYISSCKRYGLPKHVAGIDNIRSIRLVLDFSLRSRSSPQAKLADGTNLIQCGSQRLAKGGYK
jgi:hypothetical protein